MGGAETLVVVDGYGSLVVFSEEVVPGAGNPYDRLLRKLRERPTMLAVDAARVFVEEFHAEYQGGRASITKSAIDMTRLRSFVGAWDALATELRDNVTTHAAPLAAVIPRVQNYDFAYLRDFGDFLAQLQAVSGSSALNSRIVAVKNELAAGLIVRNAFYSSTAYGARDVSRSTGISVLLPSGGNTDRLPSAGPGSLSSYRSLYPDRPWTAFLERWLATAPFALYYDQGSNPLQLALAWDSAAARAGVDIDLWVLEPDGNLYIPYLGVVTPNGTLSSDSHETGWWFEVYVTRRYVERGVYDFFGELWTDPNNYQPQYNVYYRFSWTADWQGLYSSPYPTLSKRTSWRNDPNPTWDEVKRGLYTDLRWVATWDVTSAAGAHVALHPGSAQTPSRQGPTLAAPQLERVQQLLLDPKVQETREAARAAGRARSAFDLASLATLRAAARELHRQ